MKLSDLPARELARLDAVCLEFESRLRQRMEPLEEVSDDFRQSIEEEIRSLVLRHGGDHGQLLKTELDAIYEELLSASSGPSDSSGASGQGSASEPQAETRWMQSSETPATDRDGQGSAPPAGPDGSQRAVPVGVATPPGSSSVTQLPTIGTRLGPYLITSVLGRGGMGIVYRATDTRLDRSVAIKMLAVGRRHAEPLAERFQREAKAIAALTHPNIVELFDIGVYQSMPYAVMEHLKGETLQRRLVADRLQEEPITVEMVRQWGIQLSDALATAHAGGVIHRDLKPENVMLTAVGTAGDGAADSTLAIPSLKLFDFGLSRVGQSFLATDGSAVSDSGDRPARASGGPRSTGISPTLPAASLPGSAADMSASDWEPSDSQTRAGMILGTPGYMAPEQARGDRITPAVDIFALGCVLFEAFYGGWQAFPGDTPAKRYAAVLENDPLPHPGRRRDDVALADLIQQMLSKDPADRPSAAGVTGALRARTIADSPVRNGDGAADPAEADRIGKAGGRQNGSTFAAVGTDGHTAATPEPSRQTGESPALVNRRRLIELSVGGIAGALVGTTYLAGGSAELQSVRSIGVLSFVPAEPEGEAGGGDRLMPAGDRDIDLREGELLAGMLVNELSQLEGISVPKYVPMVVPDQRPESFRRAARLLEVDALITGTLAPVGKNSGLVDVHLQIISGRTGKLITGIDWRTRGGDHLVQKAALAREVADRIGHRLTTSDQSISERDPEAFTCLVKGRTYADLDSELGLRRAVACFQHALTLDEQYAKALAGLALTSITLAARTGPAETGTLISQAIQNANAAIAQAPENSEARLARAMLDYQVMGESERAYQELIRLSQTSPNFYQVHYQLGWLQCLRQDAMQGIRSLRLATQLHPASTLLDAELARAEWYRGKPERAIDDLVVGLSGGADGTVATDLSETRYARGVLIDLLEHSGQLDRAASYDRDLQWQDGMSESEYYTARAERLAALPYGPFGPVVNEAILQLRRTDELTREPASQQLSRLLAAQSPALVLMLGLHPSFQPMARLPEAVDRFPLLSPS